MAAIDKIYGISKDWMQLHAWLVQAKPEYLRYLYPMPEDDGPISNFPSEVDKWLLKNCPLEFVVSRIKEQHGID